MKIKSRLSELISNIIRTARKKENLIIEVFSYFYWVIIGIWALYLYFFKSYDIFTIIYEVFPILIASLTFLFYLIKKRRQTVLISFTTQYFLEGGESVIDDLLGILIGGRWRTIRVDPIRGFFRSLEKICLESDYEMRRRVAEALPVLFEIDLEESENLMRILRVDWDENWRSDNRRRAIEALPYLINKDKRFAKDMLQIIDKDEIFTIIALVEALYAWKAKINTKEADELFKKTENELSIRGYDPNGINAIRELWNLLELVNVNLSEAVKKFDDLKDSENLYIQICIIRNLKYLAKRFPNKLLDLMEYFMRKGVHKNVKRPIVKGDTIECLINLLRYRDYSRKVQDIIWDLIKDSDDIIRIAIFDRVERIFKVNKEFAKDIIKYVEKNEKLPRLVRRANALRKRLL